MNIYREAETSLSYLFFTISSFFLFTVSQSIGRGSRYITFPILLDITSLLGIRIAIGYIRLRFLESIGL